MDIQLVSLIIAAFVSASLFIASLMRNFRSQVSLSMALVCLLLFSHDVLAIWNGFRVESENPYSHAFITWLLGPAIFWLLAEISNQKKFLKKTLFVYGFLTAFAIGFYILSAKSRWSSLEVTLSHILLAVPAFFSVLIFRKAESGRELARERLRQRNAKWGAIITIAFYVTDALNYSGVWHLAPLGTLARTLYLFFLFQTFIQRELLTLDEIITKIVHFGGVALIFSAIYLLLVSWVGDEKGLFFFNTFIASFVMIVLYDPIRNQATWITRKILLKRNFFLETELARLSNELLGMVDPQEISKRINVTLKKTLGVKSLGLYLLDRDELSYLHFGEGSASDELSVSSPLVEYMTLRRGRAFVVETIENDRDSFRELQSRKFCEKCVETMRNLSADLIIPFHHESKLIGFCTVLAPDRMVFSNEQLRLFIPIARQIAMQLKSSQTFLHLRNRDKLSAVGEMAAGLAHEIKNPLGAIRGAVELLEDGPEDSKDLLRIIKDETDRLSHVLSDFLDYAKPRRNHPEVACDPVRVIEHVAQMVLRDTKVAFELNVEKNVRIKADPEIVKQILLNLFLNAVQAVAEQENPALKVTVREVGPEPLFWFSKRIPLHKVIEGWEVFEDKSRAPLAEIEVSDNGVGIRKEDLPRLFIPFYTTKRKGTGLGLPISQRLVESIGGSIQVKNNRDQGSVFTVHLPLANLKEKEATEWKILPRHKEIPV